MLETRQLLSGSGGYSCPPAYYAAMEAQQAAAEAATTSYDYSSDNYSAADYAADYASTFTTDQGSGQGSSQGSNQSSGGPDYTGYTTGGPPPVDPFEEALQKAINEANATYEQRIGEIRQQVSDAISSANESFETGIRQLRDDAAAKSEQNQKQFDDAVAAIDAAYESAVESANQTYRDTVDAARVAREAAEGAAIEQYHVDAQATIDNHNQTLATLAETKDQTVQAAYDEKRQSDQAALQTAQDALSSNSFSWAKAQRAIALASASDGTNPGPGIRGRVTKDDIYTAEMVSAMDVYTTRNAGITETFQTAITSASDAYWSGFDAASEAAAVATSANQQSFIDTIVAAIDGYNETIRGVNETFSQQIAAAFDSRDAAYESNDETFDSAIAAAAEALEAAEEAGLEALSAAVTGAAQSREQKLDGKGGRSWKTPDQIDDDYKKAIAKAEAKYAAVRNNQSSTGDEWVAASDQYQKEMFEASVARIKAEAEADYQQEMNRIEAEHEFSNAALAAVGGFFADGVQAASEHQLAQIDASHAFQNATVDANVAFETAAADAEAAAADTVGAADESLTSTKIKSRAIYLKRATDINVETQRAIIDLGTTFDHAAVDAIEERDIGQASSLAQWRIDRHQISADSVGRHPDVNAFGLATAANGLRRSTGDIRDQLDFSLSAFRNRSRYDRSRIDAIAAESRGGLDSFRKAMDELGTHEENSVDARFRVILAELRTGRIAARLKEAEEFSVR